MRSRNRNHRQAQTGRSLRALPVLLSVLLLGGCVAEPIAERLELEYLDDGATAITLSVEIAPGSYDVARRDLTRVVRALLDHRDAWAERFEEVDALHEFERSEKAAGQLVRYFRGAVVPRERYSRFFAGSSITIVDMEGDGWREVVIFPGERQRASTAQQRLVDESFQLWSKLLVEYLGATAELYAYLDSQPQRARSCIGHLFFEFTSDEERPLLGDLIEDERLFVNRVRRSIDAVVARWAIDSARLTSLGEAVRLVYDPLPAPLTVTVPGDVVGFEGFEPVGERSLRIARRLPGDALLALEGRWTEPELLTLYLDATENQPHPIDLDAIAALPRRASGSVAPSDIREALADGLRLERSYRVRWSV